MNNFDNRGLAIIFTCDSSPSCILKMSTKVLIYEEQRSMKKQKFVFNNQTLQYEIVSRTNRSKLLSFFGYCSAVLVTTLILFLISSQFITTPNERVMQREMVQLEYQLKLLGDEYDQFSAQINQLQSKDAEVHRVVFGVNPIDEAVWNGGTGGHEKFPYLNRFTETGELLGGILEKSERLKRKFEIQEKSLDTIMSLALSREEKLASIPSIKPVSEDKLKRKIRHLSGYGIRIHPVHKVKKFHRGIDFTAPRGTTIQATGNGTVIKVEKKKLGYGRNVVIDHGYGYQSLYAHMQDINVKEGEKVRKGQKIGTVGSSGTSTAPHLHYEIRLNGKSVNPIDYCMDGLSPEEYQELLAKAAEMNQSFD